MIMETTKSTFPILELALIITYRGMVLYGGLVNEGWVVVCVHTYPLYCPSCQCLGLGYRPINRTLNGGTRELHGYVHQYRRPGADPAASCDTVSCRSVKYLALDKVCATASLHLPKGHSQTWYLKIWVRSSGGGCG